KQMTSSANLDSPYLAVIDTCQEGNAPSGSYLENTIGGRLRLPRRLAARFNASTVATCGRCGQPMFNLMQLSCSLFGLSSHRLLYFLICSNSACLSDGASPLRCLRVQFALDIGESQRSSSTNLTSANATAVAAASAGYTDWGGDEADDWGDGETTDAAVDELQPPAMEMEELEAEAADEAAETLELTELASLDSPCRRLAVLMRPSLPQRASRCRNLAAPSFAVVGNGGGDSSVAADDNGEDEQGQALTRLEQKFYDRLARCPGQLLRYQWSGRPLLVAPMDPAAVSDCRLCGAARCFELQLMPGLLTALPSCIAEHLDLATALVYTCSAACEPPAGEDRGFAEETVLIQRELPPTGRPGVTCD
uniref:PDCD2_C domain-containing protein n=1 Tax=Macrostomum lignano TaxID=282301 RepID=A0A1I8GMW2_9PLAT